MDKIKISIPGGNGRMGRTLISQILNSDNLTLSSSNTLANEKEVGIDLGTLVGLEKINKKLTDDKYVIYQDTDVIIDFTTPESSLFHAQTASEKGIPIVIGTTGFDKKQLELLKNLSTFIPIVISANFSIGISVMQSLIKDCVKKLGFDWDIEVLETHHNQKVDAPSGTALLIGNAAAEARKQKLEEVKSISRDGFVGKRKKNEIGFAVLRGGDVVVEHSMRFYNKNERIEINHIATSRSIFASGAIRSAIWAKESKPGFYSLEDVFS